MTTFSLHEGNEAAAQGAVKIKESQWKCTVCGLSNQSKISLEEHIALHSRLPEDTWLICRVCQEVFNNTHDLSTHLKSHDNQNEENGEETDFQLLAGSRSEPLLEYTDRSDQTEASGNISATMPTRKDLMCDVCGKILSNEYALFKHKARPPVTCRPKPKKDVQPVSAPQVNVEHNCEKCGKLLSKNGKHMFSRRERFVCDICCTGFSTTRKLFIHLSGVHNRKMEKRYHCEKCGELLNSKGRHVVMSRKERYMCEVCCSRFTTDRRLYIHMARVHNQVMERPYQCETCGKTFLARSRLKGHQKYHRQKVDETKPAFSCKQCGKKMRSQWNLSRHERVHTKRFECGICGKTFMYMSNCKVHLASHSVARPLMCEFCGKTFKCRAHLRAHCKIHSEEKRHECEICQKKFLRKQHAKLHMRIHTGEKPYRCRTCGHGFAKLEYLKSHQAAHTGVHPFECTMCKKPFRLKESLVVHFRIHSGERPFKCETCGKGFRSRTMLNVHNAKHGVGKHKCEVCRKIFGTAPQLKLHQSTHNGKKTHKCDVCGQGFTYPASLIVHRRVHTGERLFSCSECGKDFASGFALKRHRQVHSQLLKYKCGTCEKRFRYRDSLIMHQRTHHMNQHSTEIRKTNRNNK